MAAAFESEAFEFNTRLRRLDKLADCAELFRQAILPFGYDTFACGELDLAVRERAAFYIIGWPEAWRKFYLDSRLIEHDPIVDALQTRREPFTWTDLRNDNTLPRLGTEALNRAAAHGWVDGLVVPLSHGLTKVGLVSMAGHRRDLGPDEKAYLCLISVCLHGHARTLLSREGFAVPPGGLTHREMECLKLVAQGRSDRAIAQEMEIAVSTAHEYVENAKRKLKTRSRAETIAVAASLGIVDF
jgi:DNA-binding CsgD family transcriptional regulator